MLPSGLPAGGRVLLPEFEAADLVHMGLLLPVFGAALPAPELPWVGTFGELGEHRGQVETNDWSWGPLSPSSWAPGELSSGEAADLTSALLVEAADEQCDGAARKVLALEIERSEQPGRGGPEPHALVLAAFFVLFGHVQLCEWGPLWWLAAWHRE